MHATNLKIHGAADAVEQGIDAVAAKLAPAADSLDAHTERLQAQVRSIGRALAESAKALGDQAGSQPRTRPWLAVGVAFVGGFLAARALRR